ncbi:hypothetical protein B0H16DRAFT_1473769 [Mycena metata]|uniref:Uncharacterized protein n=1 Tax=Mycena metata TaxID=1033252 RepID=A0AAD7MKP8_9AGAR|nr:hypothetical protein B0H16DRAFT_1473769 [Mycena metata]
MFDESYDFRLGLGLEGAREYKHAHYIFGTGRAWMCLLHFQVLDFMLVIGSSPSPASTEPSSVGPLELTSFKHPRGAFHAMPGSLPSNIIEIDFIRTDTPVQSLAPVVAFAQVEANSLETKTFKNLQAMQAALAWILEASWLSSRAYIFGHRFQAGDNRTGVLLFEVVFPTFPAVKLNLPSLDFPSTKLLNRWSVAHIHNILRPLSYALNISPVLAFCNLNLSKMFFHVDVEKERPQINHLLFVAGRPSPALASMEQRIHNLIRSSTHIPLAESLKTVNANGFTGDIPRYTQQDTGIFSVSNIGVLARFKLAQGSQSGLESPTKQRTISETDLTDEREEERTSELLLLDLYRSTKFPGMLKSLRGVTFHCEPAERISVENTSRDLKRKYEEESESAEIRFEDSSFASTQEVQGVGARDVNVCPSHLRLQNANFPIAWIQPKILSLLYGINCRNQKPR